MWKLRVSFLFRVLVVCLALLVLAADMPPRDVPPREGPNPPTKDGDLEKSLVRAPMAVIRGNIRLAANVKGRPLGDLVSSLDGRREAPMAVVTVYRVFGEGMMVEERPWKTVTAPLRFGKVSYRVEVPARAKVCVRAVYVGEWVGLPETEELRVEPIDGNRYFLCLGDGEETTYHFVIESAEKP